MSEMPALDTSTVPPSMLDETVQPVPQTQSQSNTTPEQEQEQEKPRKNPRKKRHRRYNGTKRRASTLKVSSKRRYDHNFKSPKYFDVVAVLKDGTEATIRLTRTPKGWRDMVLSVDPEKMSSTFEIKPDLYTLVCNEYVHCETPGDVIEWMTTDFQSVSMINTQY